MILIHNVGSNDIVRHVVIENISEGCTAETYFFNAVCFTFHMYFQWLISLILMLPLSSG
jgi:hypothetical protein